MSNGFVSSIGSFLARQYTCKSEDAKVKASSDCLNFRSNFRGVLKKEKYVPMISPVNLWQYRTPLRSDLASRELMVNQFHFHPSPAVGKKPANKLTDISFLDHFWLKDKRSSKYKITIVGNSPLSCDFGKDLIQIVEDLNCFALYPVKKFYLGKYDYSFYRGHAIYLPEEKKLDLSKVKREDIIKISLVHEMGHGIYNMGFSKNSDWNLIFHLALGAKNYEIIDESSFFKLKDSFGHPFDSASESFASAMCCYYLSADKFAKYIMNKNTPLIMRQFGKLVWCFLREKVFRGKVFTSDGKDPFADKSLKVLLDLSRVQRIRMLTDALLKEETRIRMKAACELMLRGHMNEVLIQALIDGFADVNCLVRKLTIEALIELSVREQVLKSNFPQKVMPHLIRALKDPSKDVRYLAAVCLRNFKGVTKKTFSIKVFQE